MLYPLFLHRARRCHLPLGQWPFWSLHFWQAIRLSMSTCAGSVLVLVSAFGQARIAIAKPAPVFMPHLNRIRQTLPPRFVLRLPADILLSDPADEDFISELKVRVYASDQAPGIIIALYSCEDLAQFCLVGMVSVTSYWSPVVRKQYAHYQAIAAPVTLAPALRGYLLEGSAKLPTSAFSTLIWQQEDMVYSLTFAQPERRNLLFMAQSMASQDTITSLNPAFQEPPSSKR
jgi:hypothetical protein